MPNELERATEAAVAAFEETKRLPSYARRDALAHVAACIERDADELATLLSRESGKPIRDARGEVARGALTFRTAAEEALRINGEWLPLDWAPANKGRHGIVRRYAIGPVAGISPFNFPLNLAAHKVAPAIAAGCSIVLKPPSKDPLVMLRIAGYLSETDLPAGAVSILPMDRPTGDRMVSDDRFKLLSFTGSPSVGWKMKAEAGKKKVVLELGGNAGAIVDETADLDWAVERLVYGSFAYAGQVCISVQRIYVVRAIYDEFASRFVERVRRVKMGDPLDPATELGPMVDEKAVQRTHGWVTDAIRDGARALVSGEPDGRWYPPTVLVDVPRDAMICSEEAFAPVVNLFAVDTFADALGRDQRQPLRPAVRRVHRLARPRLRCPRRARGRRHHRQRRSDLANRRDAVRGRQGLRARSRGTALEHRGHDRAAAAGVRTHAVVMTVAAPRYARILRADELRDGELIPVEIDGTPVVLVRHAGEFFAVQNNCSHKDFPLSEAGFDPRDGVLVCAWHGGCFDVRTGDAVVPPATEPVETFAVRVIDGWVELALTGSLAPRQGAA